jgi:hypothetical protein
MAISTGRPVAGTMTHVFRRPEPPPITRDEFTHLIALLMRMDWKLDLILEELEIDHGEEED